MTEVWRRGEIIGMFAAMIGGSLLHFVYDWSGGAAAAAPFAAVNESTWEHMKLLTVPWLLWTVVEQIRLKGEDGILFSRAMGLLAGLLFIPMAYYTYVGIGGRNIDWVNILIFQLAAIAATGVTARVQGRACKRGGRWEVLGGIILLLLLAMTVWWTFQPPGIPLFADPAAGRVGR